MKGIIAFIAIFTAFCTYGMYWAISEKATFFIVFILGAWLVALYWTFLQILKNKP